MRNWSGSVRFEPKRYAQPRTLAEVTELVSAPAPIRVIGAGHSFSPVVATSGTLVNLDHLSGLVSVDTETKRVRFLAGTRLRDIPALLAPYGLALPNQGDVNPQSVAGAVSTGTHGTGLGFTGFAGTVTGLTLVRADGSIDKIDERDPDFSFYQLTLGLAGIITEVEMQCVDAFDLIASEMTENFDELCSVYADRARESDHIEFFWFPGQTDAILKVNTRVAPTEPSHVGGRSRFSQLLSEELLDNGALRLACEAAHRMPDLTEKIGGVATKLGGGRSYRAAAHEVFVSPRRVRFHEMEWAIDLNDGAEVLREIRSTVKKHDVRVSFPIEVRCASADNVAMSTAYQRESMYIAFHQYVKEDPTAYFALMTPIMEAAQGRPHWGKMNNLTREDVLRLYPRAEEFSALMANHDPDRRFVSDSVAHLLG